MSSALTEKFKDHVGIIYGYKLDSALYCRIKGCSVADASAAPASDSRVAHEVVIVLFVCEHAAAISIVIGIELHLVYECADGIEYVLTVLFIIFIVDILVKLTREAVYYYSCSCGARASGKTFKGEKSDHDYSSFVIDDRYLASEATCLFGATYYYTCTMCGTTGEELFVYGVPDKDNHVGDTKVTYVRKDGSSHTKYVVCDACNESISTQ